MGVLDDMPGARIEAVPGPDGYSGCGLEKPSWTKPKIDVKSFGTPRYRLGFILSSAQYVEVNSTVPLNDSDKLHLARKLKEQVGR